MYWKFFCDMKWLTSCLLVSTTTGGGVVDSPYCQPCPVSAVCVPCVPVMVNPPQPFHHVEFINFGSVAPPQSIAYHTGEFDAPNYRRGRKVLLPPSPKAECHDYLCKVILHNRKNHLSKEDGYNIRFPVAEHRSERTEKVTRRKCRFIHECETSEVIKYRN